MDRAFERTPALKVEGRDLLSTTFSRMDVRAIVEEAGLAPPADEASIAPTGGAAAEPRPSPGILEALDSPDAATVNASLESFDGWGAPHVPALARLLARDAVAERVPPILVALAETALPYLAAALRDENADFVIRRRIPRVLAAIGSPDAEDPLLDVLVSRRFEVRYRAAIALVRRRKQGLACTGRDWNGMVWEAVRTEVTRDVPLLELHRLLDTAEWDNDGFVVERVGRRGELSLEHVFRLLTLVLDPGPVRAAYHGIQIS